MELLPDDMALRLSAVIGWEKRGAMIERQDALARWLHFDFK